MADHLPAAAASGIAAVVLAATGLTLPQISLGLCGALLGLAGADRTSTTYWIARLVASAVCSAAMGAGVGDYYRWTPIVTNATICVVGILLHVIIAWAGSRFAPVADAGLKKVGVDLDPGETP